MVVGTDLRRGVRVCCRWRFYGAGGRAGGACPLVWGRGCARQCAAANMGGELLVLGLVRQIDIPPTCTPSDMHWPLSPTRMIGECVTCRLAQFGETNAEQAENMERMAKDLSKAQQRIAILTDANNDQRKKINKLQLLFDEGVSAGAKQEREMQQRARDIEKRKEEEEVAMFGLKFKVEGVVEEAMHWRDGRTKCDWLKQALAIAYQMGEIEIRLGEFSLTALLRAGSLEVGDNVIGKGGEVGVICVSGEEMNSLVAVIGNESGYYRRPEDWIAAKSNKRIAKNRIEKQLREIVVQRGGILVGSLCEIWQETLERKGTFSEPAAPRAVTMRGLQFHAASLQRLGAEVVAPVRAIVAGCASWTPESGLFISRSVAELLTVWAQTMQLLTTVANPESL